MKKISLSINPTYLCNFRCEFCYLTPAQLADKSKLDPKRLVSIISEVKNAGYEIEHVDLYGGEVGLLSSEYLEELDSILFEHANDPHLNIVTNLSRIHPFFLKEHVDLSVSFDFEAREKSDLVFSNILSVNKNIAILMLASKKLLNMDIDKMINTFNSIQNIVSVEIKPYSSNQANQLGVNDLEFESFVQKWLDYPLSKDFTFVNEENIKLALTGNKNAFSDDHIYITPDGKIGVLEFDAKDNEYFLKLESFDGYLDWTNMEKNRVTQCEVCKQCEFFGGCLTEHYRSVQQGSKSCNGYRNLLINYREKSCLI